MNSVRKILVPVDFSEDSANGLRYALSLAQETQAELLVLHVTSKKDAEDFPCFLANLKAWPMANVPASIPVDRLVREKTLDLNYFLQKHVRNPALVRISRRVVLGRKSKQILEVVEKERIDLVVLAFRRKSFFHSLVARGKLLQGIGKFPCPVLLKPPTPSWA